MRKQISNAKIGHNAGGTIFYQYNYPHIVNSHENTSSFRKECGAKGEQEAKNWLEQQGFQIGHTNWRSGRFEVDIIAFRNQVLHFVEVKASRQKRNWLPEERVNRQKINHLKEAAAAYLSSGHSWRNFQIDIIAIQWSKAGEPVVHYIPDVGD